jgi:hypothetical protein
MRNSQLPNRYGEVEQKKEGDQVSQRKGGHISIPRKSSPVGRNQK